jgi:hypothetical protein
MGGPIIARILHGFVFQTAPIRAGLGLDMRRVFYKKSLLLRRLGRIAQRESVPFTRERSKVRSLVRPPASIFPFYNQSVCAKRLPDLVPMTPQKLIVLFTTLTGGAVGLFAPVGVVKWLLQTEPEDAGILTLFFFPVWCLIFALGLLIGRRLGMVVTGGKRVLQR